VEYHYNKTPLVIIDGKEAVANQTYLGIKGGYYKVTRLGENEAINKYGEKGKSGATEIITVPPAGFKQRSNQEYLFNPYKPNPKSLADDGC
jgi:hypothetical protein